MSLDKIILSDLMESEMSNNPKNQKDAFKNLAKAIVEHIVNNLEIDIPPGAVIKSVTGGSGAPAIGVPSSSKIRCTVK